VAKLSDQQKAVLAFVVERGDCSRHAPHTLRLRGGPGKTLTALRGLGLIEWIDDKLIWRATDAGRAVNAPSER
jgi:hypothetical protein